LKLKYLSKLLVFGLVFNSTQAGALILEQKVTLLTGVEFDSNPAFASSNEQSVWRYTALPTYTASFVEDRNRWFTTASLSLQRSSDSVISESRQDPNLIAGWEHEYERGLFNITADYSKTSSRLNEFTSNGVVDKDGSATTKSISASWSRLLTDRLNLSAAGQYLQVNYAGSGLSNYKTKSISSSLTYELDEKVSPFVQVGVSELNSEASNTQSKVSQSYLVGTKALLRPNLNMSTSLGINHRQGSGNGLVANLTMTYLAEKYNAQGSLSRNVTASGIGEFQETNNLSLKYAYELSDKARVGSEFGWSSNGSTGGNRTMQIGGWYSKEISELWQLKFNLNLKQLNNDSQSASSNIIGISFNYNTPDF
jgi:hypothetical protein